MENEHIELCTELRRQLARWHRLRWALLPGVLLFWGVTAQQCWSALSRLTDAGAVERNSEPLALALIVTVVYVHLWAGIFLLWLGFSRWRRTRLEVLVMQLLSAGNQDTVTAEE